MNLFCAILADFLVAVHLVYVSYVVLGQLVILMGWALRWSCIRNPWFRVSHLVMILIVAFEAVIEYECPLTTWERELRNHVGQTVNPQSGDREDVSFMARMMREVVYRDEQWTPYLTPGYYTFAGIVLATVILIPPRFRRVQAPRAGLPATPDAPTVTESATVQGPQASAAQQSH